MIAKLEDYYERSVDNIIGFRYFSRVKAQVSLTW